MNVRFIVIITILLLGFLASRIRFEEAPPQQQPPQKSVISSIIDSIPQQPSSSDPKQSIDSGHSLFNLNGEWRGVLQPLHGSHLDPRDWNLELKLFISDHTAKVYLRRGEQWTEVKSGKFKINRHKTNATIHSIDSGGGWVESWVFSISRYDEDNINVYGNRIINNFHQDAGPSGRITYGATGQFKRVYERHLTSSTKKLTPLSESDIASQIAQAVRRGKGLSGDGKPGKLSVFEQKITHETDDSAILQVKYHYDGNADDNAYISAITYSEGKSTGHWSFRPVKLKNGKRAAQIRVGMSSASPDKYCSDSFVIQAYLANGGNFFEKPMPYERCWSKSKL